MSKLKSNQKPSERNRHMVSNRFQILFIAKKFASMLMEKIKVAFKRIKIKSKFNCEIKIISWLKVLYLNKLWV